MGHLLHQEFHLPVTRTKAGRLNLLPSPCDVHYLAPLHQPRRGLDDQSVQTKGTGAAPCDQDHRESVVESKVPHRLVAAALQDLLADRVARNLSLSRGKVGNGVEKGDGDRSGETVSYTHLRAHETRHDLVCRLLLE